MKRITSVIQELNVAAQAEFEQWLASRNRSDAMSKELDYLTVRVDSIIRSLLVPYLEMSEEERQTTSATVNTYGRKALLGFGARMAARGVTEKSVAILREGLLALAAEAGLEDPRESMIVMAMLYHSLSKLGADADGVFRDVAQHASAGAQSLIVGFAERDPQSRDLSAFFVTEKYDPDGRFTYHSAPQLR